MVTENTFKLILPNKNRVGEGRAKQTPVMTDKVTPQMKTVLDYLAEYGEMTDEDFQELLGIKRTRSYILARQMCEAGVISRTGRGDSKRYYLNQ